MKGILLFFPVLFLVVLIPIEGECRGSSPPLKITPSIKTFLSEGQNVKFSASGGVPPYSFSANIGSINAKTGDYTASSSAGNGIGGIGITSDLSGGVGGNIECTNRFNSYLDYAITRGIAPIIPEQAIDLNNSCSGAYGLGLVGGNPECTAKYKSYLDYAITRGLPPMLPEQASDFCNRGIASIKVTDKNGNTATYNVAIYKTLRISPSLKIISKGNPFTFYASGGIPPYVFSTDLGTINSVSGFFTASGDAGSGKVTVRDSINRTATADVTINEYKDGIGGVNCYAKGVSSGGGSLPYNQTPVVGHGNPGNLVWSSSALSSTDQKILTTDARFNLRIVAKAAPPKGTKDYKGFICNYEGLAYTKIKLTVGLRRPNSNVYTGFYDLSDIPVGKCSNVLEFANYQIPVTDGPIVLDIFNFKHDYYCNIYENSRYADNPSFCPYVPLSYNDCFSIEVQFSTDYTLDIPH